MSVASRIAERVRELRIFGTKATVLPTQVPAAAVSQGSFWGTVRESFAGAWQRNFEINPTEAILAFSAVYACVSLIAGDISKLRIKLVAFDHGVWTETANTAYSPVLRKPNEYQTRIQFLSSWVTSKLIHGNTYVLKQRDARGVVTALHVLNPRMVKALVAEDGSVFYSMSNDKLAQTQSVVVPASEIIHDRGVCLYHPLVGVGPIFACGMSSTQGQRIQQNSGKFFENMSRPSGVLTAAGVISDETAERLKREFESNFSHSNIGRLLVMGDGLKYEAMTIPAQQAQLIEQLKWTVEDVARCFHVPLHKIASDSGVKFNNMAAMNQDYYSQCLQEIIESIELLLDEGLGMTGGTQLLGTELDLDGLLRMDPAQRATVNETGIKAGYLKPNEARASENRLPVAGGDTPYMQVQNYSLEALSKQPAPGSTPPPAPPAPAAGEPSADPAGAAATAAAAAAAGKAVEDISLIAKTVLDQVTAAAARVQTASVEAAAEQSRVADERVADVVRAAQETTAELLRVATEQRAAAEEAAERHRADQMAIFTRAVGDIAEERALLAAERQRIADEARVASAAAEIDPEDDAAILVQALIDRFTQPESAAE